MKFNILKLDIKLVSKQISLRWSHRWRSLTLVDSVLHLSLISSLGVGVLVGDSYFCVRRTAGRNHLRALYTPSCDDGDTARTGAGDARELLLVAPRTFPTHSWPSCGSYGGEDAEACHPICNVQERIIVHEPVKLYVVNELISAHTVTSCVFSYTHFPKLNLNFPSNWFNTPNINIPNPWIFYHFIVIDS